jgi:putative phosphoribosyl transferase
VSRGPCGRPASPVATRLSRLARRMLTPSGHRRRTVSFYDRVSMERTLSIPTGGIALQGDLRLVDDARGLVVFAHGSGSSRKSARNRHVARALEHHGLATLLLDLLTADEADADAIDASLRFDIPLLARRLGHATDELVRQKGLGHLPIGYFGASTGAAAALIAAAERPNVIRAVVSRGGRPDLAREALALVRTPTLLIVGSADTTVLRLNQAALAQMQPRAGLAIVAGATHLFEEPGALDEVASLAARWFVKYLTGAALPAGDGPRTVTGPAN